MTEQPYGYYTSFSNIGYYLMRCSAAARELLAVGNNGTDLYAGNNYKPSQGNYRITVNIYTYKQN